MILEPLSAGLSEPWSRQAEGTQHVGGSFRRVRFAYELSDYLLFASHCISLFLLVLVMWTGTERSEHANEHQQVNQAFYIHSIT